MYPEIKIEILWRDKSNTKIKVKEKLWRKVLHK